MRLFPCLHKTWNKCLGLALPHFQALLVLHMGHIYLRWKKSAALISLVCVLLTPGCWIPLEEQSLSCGCWAHGPGSHRSFNSQREERGGLRQVQLYLCARLRIAVQSPPQSPQQPFNPRVALKLALSLSYNEFLAHRLWAVARGENILTPDLTPALPPCSGHSHHEKVSLWGLGGGHKPCSHPNPGLSFVVGLAWHVQGSGCPGNAAEPSSCVLHF